MPTYRGITISLQSQYDAHPIPESAMFVRPKSSGSNGSLGSPSTQELNSAPSPRESRCCIVHASVPTFKSSQFWISYSCFPPTPSPETEEVRFYYFKLVAKSKCILSWGVGEQEEWSGKTMYALFSAGTDFEGRKVVEKRGLFFPKNGVVDAAEGLEIHVFRAKARKREPTRYENLKQLKLEPMAFDLTNIGRVRKGERQRMYTYALIDPKDEPYVIFEYSFGASAGATKTLNSLHFPFSKSGAKANKQPAKSPDTAPRSLRRHLSIPPQRKLLPTTTRKEPSSPIKKPGSSDDNLSGSDLDPDEAKRRDWVIRTPSPMVSRLFDKPTTPPSERRKAGSGGGLRNIFASALNRKDEKSG